MWWACVWAPAVYVTSVGAVWLAQLQHVSSWQVCCGDGRPALGHPHGAALWNDVRRWNEEAQRSHSAGRWIHISLGHWKVTVYIYIIFAPQSQFSYQSSYVLYSSLGSKKRLLQNINSVLMAQEHQWSKEICFVHSLHTCYCYLLPCSHYIVYQLMLTLAQWSMCWHLTALISAFSDCCL